MSDFCLPTLEKFAYHIHNIKILSKHFCKVKKRDVFISKPSSIWTVRDYTERFSAHFNLETHSDHFGNGRSLSIEGCSVEVYINDSSSCLQLTSRQDASTTNANMMKIIDNLKQKNKI